jgi:hypothetical protein
MDHSTPVGDCVLMLGVGAMAVVLVAIVVMVAPEV